MELNIKPAGMEHSQAIAALSGQLGYGTGAENTGKRLSEIIADSHHCAYVAIHHQNIVGWIHGFYTLRIESDAFVEIGGLVIDEKYRQKGIGKLLVQKVSEWAASKNVATLRVRSNTIRTEAHQFYNHIGFKEVKEQKILDLPLK